MEAEQLNFKKVYSIPLHITFISCALFEFILSFSQFAFYNIIDYLYKGFLVLSFISCIYFMNKSTSSNEQKLYKICIVFFYLIPLFFYVSFTVTFNYARHNYQLIQLISKAIGVIYFICYFVISMSLCKKEHKGIFLSVNIVLLLALLALIIIEYVTDNLFTINMEWFQPHRVLVPSMASKNSIQSFGYLFLGIYKARNKQL